MPIRLALTRPAAALRIREALESGAPGFTAIQEAITRRRRPLIRRARARG